MLGRQDWSETVVAFFVRDRDKAQQPMVDKGSCKHCGRYAHEDSNGLKIIS